MKIQTYSQYLGVDEGSLDLPRSIRYLLRSLQSYTIMGPHCPVVGSPATCWSCLVPLWAGRTGIRQPSHRCPTAFLIRVNRPWPFLTLPASTGNQTNPSFLFQTEDPSSSHARWLFSLSPFCLFSCFKTTPRRSTPSPLLPRSKSKSIFLSLGNHSYSIFFEALYKLFISNALKP